MNKHFDEQTTNPVHASQRSTHIICLTGKPAPRHTSSDSIEWDTSNGASSDEVRGMAHAPRHSAVGDSSARTIIWRQKRRRSRRKKIRRVDCHLSIWGYRTVSKVRKLRFLLRILNFRFLQLSIQTSIPPWYIYITEKAALRSIIAGSKLLFLNGMVSL